MVKRARKCDVPQDRNIVKNDLPNIHSIGQAITGLALLNFTTGEDSTLWVVNPTGSRWVLPAQHPSAATFLAGRHDAVIADDAAQEVFVMEASIRRQAESRSLRLATALMALPMWLPQQTGFEFSSPPRNLKPSRLSICKRRCQLRLRATAYQLASIL